MKQNEKNGKNQPAEKKQIKNANTSEKSSFKEKLSAFVSKNKPAVIGVSTTIVAIILIVSLILGLTTCGKSRALKKYEEDKSTEAKGLYYVAMDVKGFGVVILELDAEAAPITVANFIKLVREDFYDGLTFHRVIENFMIQGGDPDGNGTGGSDEKIFGEFSANGYNNPIKHERGVISMARSTAYNSASSQFFICNANSASVYNLDGSYAAFGHVIEGMDVIDAITEYAVPYTINGVIVSKKNHPVITEMKVIVYEE